MLMNEDQSVEGTEYLWVRLFAKGRYTHIFMSVVKYKEAHEQELSDKLMYTHFRKIGDWLQL